MHTAGVLVVVLGVLVGIAAMTWWMVGAARRTGNGSTGVADITFDDGNLVVTPRGVWKVLGMRGQMVIPLSAIDSCSHDLDPRSSHPVAIRVGGTGVPGRVLAGFMSNQGERSWWLYRYDENAIVIELADSGLSYLVIDVDDPTATVAAIQHARASAFREEQP